MNKHGFARVTVCSPKVSVGNPDANTMRMAEQLHQCRDSDVVVFPELATTGYTCGDLFRQQALLDASDRSLAELAVILGQDKDDTRLVVVGAPIRVDGSLYNCAVVLNGGRIIGIVPKQHVPNYSEFYEKRYFRSAGVEDRNREVYFYGLAVPFGTDLIFAANGNPAVQELKVFVEICEDLFMPIPPSSIACMHGANLILNLSASPEQVAKAEYRTELVKNQSGRCLAAYAYSSAGPSESTSDVVFSGHCIIAENDNILTQTTYVGDGKLEYGPRFATADIDVQKCNIERRKQDTFTDGVKYFPGFRYREIAFRCKEREAESLKRFVPHAPFVPSDPAKLAARCASVFDIQCGALRRRWESIGMPDLNIGISGGLDSTHALLVVHKMVTGAGYGPSKIICKTMPGFGTTQETKAIAIGLMDALDVTWSEVDIKPQCFQMFRDLKHRPFGIDLEEIVVKAKERADRAHVDYMVLAIEDLQQRLRNLPEDVRAKGDIVFENVQAGVRTSILFRSGFVVGTGDLSELALGYCTFGVGDHMSHYNVNAGVPKTLIRFLIPYVADNHYPPGLIRDRLHESAKVEISAELLPLSADGKRVQKTELAVGAYELNDFYMFNLGRYAFAPDKVLFLAANSELAMRYTPEERVRVIKTFIQRFFGSQQFKRNTLPDGPKVGTFSLSPRGDWRMPPENEAAAWLETIK